MRFDLHKRACSLLKDIDKNPANYLIIHYSCESFYNINDGRTPRVTSIAIRSFDTGQTDSFSIHKAAEKKHIDFHDIHKDYDDLEYQMLTEYFEYIRVHKGYKWLHWNMRDINYGFKAIEHRFEVLNGEPVIIQDGEKIDIARLLIEKYGVEYILHPRMQKLIELNNLQPKDFLTGTQEAFAFQNKEYIKLHQSTLRKVDVFADLLERTIQNTLKTNAKWYQIYGLSPQGIFEFTQTNWMLQLFEYVITLLLGVFLGRIF